ncbi:MAG: hypothetical protein P8Z40_00085, partial [Chloroflexota bacterium]
RLACSRLYPPLNEACKATLLALSLRALIAFLAPIILADSSFPWEWMTYVGVLPVLAAPFAFMRKGAKPLTWLLAFVMVFAIWLALGKAVGLYALLYQLIPSFRILRIPPRALVMAVPALIVLGGLGFQSLMEESPTPNQIRISAYVYGNLILFGLGTFAGFMVTWQAGLSQLLPTQWLTGLMFLLVCLVVAGAIVQRVSWLAGWPIAIVILTIGALLGNIASHYLVDMAPLAITALAIIKTCFLVGLGVILIYALRLSKVSGAVEMLIGLFIFLDMYVYGASYVQVLDPPQAPVADLDAVPHTYHGRVHSEDDYWVLFDFPNQFVLSETGVITGYDSLKLSDYAAFVRASGLDERALDFLNVTHFISFEETPESVEAPVEGVFRRPDFTITLNPAAQPRAFWVGDVEPTAWKKRAGSLTIQGFLIGRLWCSQRPSTPSLTQAPKSLSSQ